MSSTKTSLNDIKRNWHLVDVKGKILGRISSQIAKFLIGKSKPYWVRHLDCGDYVVILNAKHVEVSGKKLEQKFYTSFSGYPGGLKRKSLKMQLERNPEFVIREAVSGMLPQNKLRDSMLRRLYVFNENDHPYKDKFSAKVSANG